MHPLGQRHKGVVGPGHEDAIFAGFFQAVAQPFGHIQHNILFQISAWRPGAVIDAAVAGIERNERPRIGAVCVRGARTRQLGAVEAAVEVDPAQKTLAICGRQIEHQPRRCAVGRVDDKGLFDAHGPGEVKNQTRTAFHDQAEAKRLDQAAPALACLRRQLECHLRNVENDPIGIGEGKGVNIDLAAEIHHEPRLRFVAAEPRIRCDRKRIGSRRNWPGRPVLGRGDRGAEKTEESPACHPDSHGFPTLRASLTPLGKRG